MKYCIKEWKANRGKKGKNKIVEMELSPLMTFYKTCTSVSGKLFVRWNCYVFEERLLEPAAGQAGVPLQGWIGETRASAGDLCPLGRFCHDRSASATWGPSTRAQQGLRNDPPGIWGKWLACAEQQTIRGLQATSTASPFSGWTIPMEEASASHLLPPVCKGIFFP